MTRANYAIAALCSLTLATTAHPQAPAPKSAAADAPFKLQCKSRSVKQMPRGNAGVGNVAFDLEVNPANQEVTVDGTEKRKATIDPYEVWFRTSDGHVISISRGNKSWRLVVPIDKVDDSRKYMFFEGTCTNPA